jgi:hypothetical protein
MLNFQQGQKVLVNSGKLYEVERQAVKIKGGEPHYWVRSLRDGKPFGPSRLIKEGNLRAAEAA